MSKAEEVRVLGREGLATAAIARQLGISYQQAYSALKAADLLPARGLTSLPSTSKPPLSEEQLKAGGFTFHGRWVRAADGKLLLEERLPATSGVYAFVSGGRALYVGVAKKSIKQRLYFYGNPGPSQSTNVRIKKRIVALTNQGLNIDVYLAHPPDLEWNGLPVSGCAGLEIGLISQFTIDWNVQGRI